MKKLKPMLPSLVSEVPKEDGWLYEPKYDGFRAIIYVEKNKISIVSRNLNTLNDQFPEIIEKLSSTDVNRPLIFDGELCVIQSSFSANFEQIQKRGRLKNKEKIVKSIKTTPVSFLAFDLLMLAGESIINKPLVERKSLLIDVSQELLANEQTFQIVPIFADPDELWKNIQRDNGEGIIAKRKESFWHEGRTKNWLKMKNMMIASFFIIAYDETNSFFHIGCLYKGEIKMIGKVGQGFTKEEKEALVAIIKKNMVKKELHLLFVKPSISIEVEFLELGTNELRHPKFRRFRFDKHWEDCTWEAIPKQQHR